MSANPNSKSPTDGTDPDRQVEQSTEQSSDTRPTSESDPPVEIDPRGDVGSEAADVVELPADDEPEVARDQSGPEDGGSPLETTGAPTRFSGAITGGTIKTVVSTIASIVEETRIHADEDGIRIRAVDPANVAMDDIVLEAAAFESYDATSGVLGVDLERFSTIIRLANSGDLVQVSLDLETRKLVVHIDGIEFTMACLDPQTIRAEPEIPDLDLPAEATVDRDALDRGVKAADMVGDHVYVRMDEPTEALLLSADGDTDEVTLEIPREELSDVTVVEAESLFGLDFMKAIVRTIPTGTSVTMTLGTDFPLIMSYDLADGDGHVTRMLAPRIRSE